MPTHIILACIDCTRIPLHNDSQKACPLRGTASGVLALSDDFVSGGLYGNRRHGSRLRHCFDLGSSSPDRAHTRCRLLDSKTSQSTRSASSNAISVEDSARPQVWPFTTSSDGDASHRRS